MRRALLVRVGLVACATLLGASCGDEKPTRQEVVAQRGALVMPFDLERTTHVFEPATYGGVQSVVADDPSDKVQVRLIREHLRAEAAAFSGGDFGDPAEIHGDDMPGLAELRRGYREINLTFEATPSGARITYRSDDSAIVGALHAWFEAQVGDHGEHAEGGHR